MHCNCIAWYCGTVYAICLWGVVQNQQIVHQVCFKCGVENVHFAWVSRTAVWCEQVLISAKALRLQEMLIYLSATEIKVFVLIFNCLNATLPLWQCGENCKFKLYERKKKAVNIIMICSDHVQYSIFYYVI